MQRNCEASLKCLQSKGYATNLQVNATVVEGLPDIQTEASGKKGGDNVEPARLAPMEPPEPLKEFHHKPAYHDFGWWPTFHPDSQQFQRCQVNASESHFYPFPLDGRFHYAPFHVFPQGYPYDYQAQEFQYFVVIDFEATCDMGKNPHPQEIIEFPSVLVNSVTGQLEACFQTYVRPTCNQLLSDFCKDLTGIQQIQLLDDEEWTISENDMLASEMTGQMGPEVALSKWPNEVLDSKLEAEAQG
ncbi:Exonuclease, RNase T/DNA polymerase III [Dillenia turbinata]|uniref:Exonuclease, RNase T/DNA polymerase III n=1 Tax=Dillenia turbinata TaxID=194707 RepID=A0AAN8VH75_9MAGN